MVNLDNQPNQQQQDSTTTPTSEGNQQKFNQAQDDPSKNPMGLGDPNDRFLRKVESEILVPKKMRDRARETKCTAEVAAFTQCCKNSSLAMVVTCRTENTNMKACLTQWYQDPAFRKECEEEYLAERSAYRRTGVKQKFIKHQQQQQAKDRAQAQAQEKTEK